MNEATREMSDEAWAKIGDPSISPKLKRLAGTVALIGVILGASALVGLLFSMEGGVKWRVVTPEMPPSVTAAALSFFAIGFGIIAIWSVKQIKGRAMVRVMALVALLLGLAGPPIFTVQAVRIHVILQTTEVERAKALTDGALAFEAAHHRMPADLLELVQSAGIDARGLQTAFGSESKLKQVPKVTREDPAYEGALHEVEQESDYVYTAANIGKEIPAELRSTIMIVRSKKSHLESQSAAVGFADGKAYWISLSDAKQVYDADSAARGKMGVGTQPASRAAGRN